MADHLARGVRSPNEDIYDDIDGSFQELTDRIKYLEKQVVKVSDEKTREDSLKHRNKDENSILIKSLVDRIHTLEEQLKDMEVKSDERVRVEQKKLHDLVSKNSLENDKVDYLTMRLQNFESENERLKTDVVRLKNENDKLRMDKMEVMDRLAAMEEDFNRVSAEYNEMMSKFDREQIMTGNVCSHLCTFKYCMGKCVVQCVCCIVLVNISTIFLLHFLIFASHLSVAVKKLSGLKCLGLIKYHVVSLYCFIPQQPASGKLLDELQKELEDLRQYKIDTEHRHGHMARTPSLTDSNGFILHAEMQKLKETLWEEWREASQANKHLAEENEELNAQLLAQTVQEGRHIMQEGSSLAEELDHMTKEELMKSLREQQDVNRRLSQYVDKILLTILEKNPSVLEKK
ncbi:uncharacterized protein LOC127870079 [Dreissena polymorpha]|uniref:uncharacterized protein LOC127870079 n=1 Tax=Dreissena polymorpha TaxID=45954 RepID=UPI002263FA3D|nr:uncharacterized protein LOC127870079 [Dreissena polymorpha]